MNNLIIYIFIFILCISSLLVSILYFINQQSSLQPKVSQSLISITSSTQPPQISIVSSTEPPKVSIASSTQPPKVSIASSTEPPKVSIIEQGTFIGKPKEPIMCSRKYEPVKCPDGNTYNNSCSALNSGWKNCVR
jgi:hypothetical protein